MKKLNEITVLEASIKLLESTLTSMPSHLADEVVKQVIILLKMLEDSDEQKD